MGFCTPAVLFLLGVAMVFADTLNSLVPKGGCAWMPQGTQGAVLILGQNQKHDMAGAMERKRLSDLQNDVEDHLQWNGPSKFQLSNLDSEPAVTTATKRMATTKHVTAAA